MFASAFAGLAFGLSLIVAIGAQNTYVLRQGLRREHVFAVVLVCMLSDAILIAAGVTGLGALLQMVPWLLTAARIIGATFLFGYAIFAAWRAWRPSGLHTTVSGGPTRMGRALLTAVALTWLNPHVYLDTVLLLGTVAGTYGAYRWAFGVGAITGSVLWFTALGVGARFLRPLFARPTAWRVLDGGIAVVMTAVAISLLTGGTPD